MVEKNSFEKLIESQPELSLCYITHNSHWPYLWSLKKRTGADLTTHGNVYHTATRSEYKPFDIVVFETENSEFKKNDFKSFLAEESRIYQRQIEGYFIFSNGCDIKRDIRSYIAYIYEYDNGVELSMRQETLECGFFVLSSTSLLNSIADDYMTYKQDGIKLERKPDSKN